MLAKIDEVFRVDVEALQDVGQMVLDVAFFVFSENTSTPALCVKALAGDETVPTRITLDSTEEDIDVSNDWDNDGNGW